MQRTRILAVLLVAGLAGCSTPPPRLADGLPAHNLLAPDPAWDQRVRERFPVGSDEKALLAELRREGFAVDTRRAVYKSSNFACTTTYVISWSAENQQISDISGQRTGVCL